MGDWIVADYISYLADVAAEWLAYGIGLGAILWVMSLGVGLIIGFVRY